MTPKQESNSIRDARISQRERYHDLNDCPGFVFRQDGTNELSALSQRERNISSMSEEVKQRTFTIREFPVNLLSSSREFPERDRTRRSGIQ